MEREFRRQPEFPSDGPEVVLDAGLADPPAALGGPQHLAPPAGQRRADFRHPLLEALGRPAEHAQDAALLRRRALHRLAVPDVEHAEATELRRLRVGAEVRDVEHSHLTPAESPGVRDLEEGGVSEGAQPPFPPALSDGDYEVVGVVEQPLELVGGERAEARPTLGLLHVRRGVPVVAHLGGVSAESVPALLWPPIRRVDDVVAKQAQRDGLRPDRGLAEVTDRPLVAQPLVDELRAPSPRVLARLADEPPDVGLAPVDCAERQIAGELLVAPALQHLDERPLRKVMAFPYEWNEEFISRAGGVGGARRREPFLGG
ncbi:MAG TPA: hypothetical protein VM388_07700 [Acidimicrobiales bacterium]|nr:hypothetical protein [Acidimicrobiales bacterium]